MEYEAHSSFHEPIRPHNPWEVFTHRNETKHRAEDNSRLCTNAQTTTSQVIERFVNFDRHRLDEQVPRRHQMLRDFLHEVVPPSVGTVGSYFDDIERHSTNANIALIDDRRQHERCAKSIGNPCNGCRIFSRVVRIPGMCQRLREERRTHRAEKRIIYIPNLTSAGALALAATVAMRSAIPVRNFLQRYLLGREHVFSAATSWGFFLEFHIPYHAIRHGPIERTQDQRTISSKRLRKSEPLPLRLDSLDREDLYYHQAQTSSLCWGTDEWFWTELFLVDTYFGSEEGHKTYFTDCNEGDGLDPPLGGSGDMTEPRFDPREYFLLKVDRRIKQVATEYSALVETFDKRMEEYARKTRRVFEDDNKRTNTKTLSNVLETIHIFVDCIEGTVDSWNTFRRSEISLFTKHAPERPTWREIIARIDRHITELDGMRKLLLTQRNRFKSKLESLHTVSSLSQTETANLQAETAVAQGTDLKVLTQMTVYIAFPLLFTTALFSMDFVQPKYPWVVFFIVLFLTSLVNYMIASQRSPRRVWSDCKAWMRATFVSRSYNRLP
ncbi:Nn.00g018530.m01.CDS01 [Neocucurbitaria sp. VM-36]